MAVTLYVWPNKNPSSKLSVYSYAYVYPHFHQNWNLFVPTPKQNFSLCVKYKSDKGEQEWNDIFYELNSVHQSNRLAGNESVLLAFSNALRYFAGSVPDKSEIITDKNSNLNFLILEKMVRTYIEKKEKSKINDLKIIVNIRSISGNDPHSHYYSETN